MKTVAFLILVIGLFVLGACTAPPTNLPSATIGDEVVTQNNLNTDEVIDTTYDDDFIDDAPQYNELGNRIVADGATRAISVDRSSFEFEGYGPVRSHVGTFEEWEGTLYFDGGRIQGLEGIVYMDSVISDGAQFENHLRSDDFFDVEQYPTARFVSTSIDETESGTVMNGQLTFRGMTRTISVPVIVGADIISAEFLLDTKPFGFQYAMVNDNVRIAFTFTI